MHCYLTKFYFDLAWDTTETTKSVTSNVKQCL